MDNKTKVAINGNFKTSIFEKISYGTGDVACNVVYALTSGLIMYFYTNVIGIGAGIVGTILLVSRIFDGIADIVIAQLMDKVNSKHGKARVWILWTSVPFAISAVLLVTVPAHATVIVQALYIFITYNLSTTVFYTALNLPYSAMAPLMTNNDEDLAKLNLFRMSMSPISNMIVTAATLPFVRMLGNDQLAWIKVTSVYAIIAFGMLMWTYFGCKERFHSQANIEAEKLSFFTRLMTTFRNKYFIIMFFTMIALAIFQTVNGTMSTYYAQYVLGNSELMGVMQTFEKAPWILTVMLLAPFIKHFGKRNLVLIGAVLCLGSLLLIIVNPRSLTLVLVSAVIRGIGEAPLNAVSLTMLADVINYGHWRTGIRVHAMVFSTYTVGQKFGNGISGWIIGELLKLSGYTGTVHESIEAVTTIKMLYIYGGAFAWLIVILLMLAYRLDKELPRINDDLNHGRTFGSVE